MELKKYISGFDMKNILEIEHSDLQFIALKNVWENLLNKKNISDSDKELFLFLIIQNALVSYQIAWWWELWWAEFADKILVDFDILRELHLSWKDNFDWWYNFLISSKYNKRIYNIKVKRLKKLWKMGNMKCYHKDMEKLLEDICYIMWNDRDSKTMVFAVKMFGYGARIVFEELILYPMSIQIPVDSRIKKISWMEDEKKIQKYFQKLSEEFKIPPLHLDSLLWIDYWQKIKK